jgi:hypothetical protein
MIGGPDHGTLTAVTLALKCDAPGCKERIGNPTVAVGALEEVPVLQQLKADAEANGWYVARDRGAVNQNWDLCPEHSPKGRVR